MFSIALILFTSNTWGEYKERYKDTVRQIEINNVEKLEKCRKPSNGCRIYGCTKCCEKRYVPFTCGTRLCTSCGRKLADEWAREIASKMFDVPHRHIVLTIPIELSRFLYDRRKLIRVLKEAAKKTMEDMIKYSSREKKKLKIGMITVTQTYGGDMKWHVHIHGIVTEGGFDEKNNWVPVSYIKYSSWRKKWQYEVLTKLKAKLPRTHENSRFINRMFKDHLNGFVIYGKKRIQNKNKYGFIRYIGRYIRHPPIAETRITFYDGRDVTFWYRDGETKKKIFVKVDKFEFINRILMHIPEKNYKLVSHAGIYSRRAYKLTQMTFNLDSGDDESVVKKMTWQEGIIITYGYDPLKCPSCGGRMELIEIRYDGIDENSLDRPPPDQDVDYGSSNQSHEYSQQERIELLKDTILNLSVGYKGADIVEAIDTLLKYGLKENKIKEDIHHLKMEGHIYENPPGRINWVV